MGDNNPDSNLIPMVARGLRALLVDENFFSLMYTSSLLEQYFYKVRTTELTSEALSIIEEGKEEIDFVIVESNMKEMDKLTFLRHILLIKDLPIIFIGCQENEDIKHHAQLEGVCVFLYKPTLNDLVNVWQHVFWWRVYKDVEKLESENGKHLGHRKVYPHGAIMILDQVQNNTENNQKQERIIHMNQVIEKTNNYEFGGYEEDNDFNKRMSEEQKSILEGTESSQRRNITSRFKWTHELHLKFEEAINILGEENAHPKIILKLMNEQNLTLRHIASHLQKYRDRLRRNNAWTTNYQPMAHAKALAVGSSVQSNVPYLQNPNSFYGNNITSTFSFCPNNINYFSENQQDYVLSSTNQALGFDTFVGMPGASKDPNAVTPPILPWAIAEKPLDDFAELFKFTEENEGQLGDASAEKN